MSQQSSMFKIERFAPGQEVEVKNARYEGPGVVSDETYYGSHFVHLPNQGMKVAVKLPNGNTWLYDPDTVTLKSKEGLI